MEATRLAGIFIILGFIIFWAGNIYSPPNVYQETDLQLRMQIVAEYPARWAISQGVGGAGIAVMVLGLLILSVRMAGAYGPWLTYVPSALSIVAVILTSVYLYQYINDSVT